MEIAAQRSNIIYRPLGITLGILTTVLFWWLFSSNPTTLALLAIAALFLFGLKRPVWSIAALLVAQLTVTSYMVSTPFGSISLRLLLLILTLIVMFSAFTQRQISLGSNTRRIFIPILILISVSIISNVANSEFDSTFRDFRNMLVGLMIVILIPAATRNVKDLKILCGVSFIAIVASSLLGLMQHYQLFGMDQATLIPGYLELESENLRVPGMAETELELAYVLATTILIVLSICLVKGVNSGNRKLLFLSMPLMTLTLYFTYTRSALFALGLGLIALLLFLKTRIHGGIIISAFLLILIVIEMTGILGGLYIGGRPEIVQEESAVTRKILWQSGIDIALDNPILGIGVDNYGTISPEYSTSVDPSLLEWEEERYYEYSTLGMGAIHNDFLYFWVSYGTPALIVYIWLYVVILGNLLKSYRMSKTRFIKGLALGLAIALVAYGVNSFYHNLIATLSLFWTLVGLSLATTKLALNDKLPKRRLNM